MKNVINYIKNKNKLLIIGMCVILFVILLLILILNIREEESRVYSFATNTMLINENVESYKVSVRIKGKNTDENYVIVENGTKNSSIYFSNDKKGKFSDEIYKNTDKFLEGLKYVIITKEEIKTIENREFRIKEFDIKTNDFNKMIEEFDIKVNKDGKGKVYIDSNDKVYLLIYNCDDIKINVSYSLIEENK